MPDRRNPLLALVSRLGEAASLDDVINVVLTHAGIPVGADATILSVIDSSGSHIEVYTSASDQSPTVVDIESSSPLCVAARTGESVVVRVDDVQDDHAKPLVLPGDASWLVSAGMPGPTGSVTFAFSSGFEPTVHDVNRVKLIAKWIGGAIESSVHRGQARVLVNSLTSQLLQHGHTPAGLEVAGGYRPPWPGEPMGGDWFDAFTASGGTGVVVVGDVAGHGISVAPAMIALRSYVRALAFLDPQPQHVFNAIDQMLTEFSPGPGLLTIAIGMVDSSTRTMLLVNAGLPPPILRRSDGTTSFIEAGRSRLLGTGFEPLHDPPAEIPLNDGDIVVFTTDGVLQSESEGPEGMGDILETVREDGDGDLDRLVDRILELTAGHDARTDDATAFAMRIGARLEVASDG